MGSEIDLSLLFAGTSGPRDATIVGVGEAYGAEEARQGRPFVGESGALLTDLLASSGINRSEMLLTNLINARPAGNDMKLFFHKTAAARKAGAPCIDGLYPKPELIAGLAKLRAQLAVIRPKLVIGFGNYPLWALTQGNYKIRDASGYKVPAGIVSWRGSQLRIQIGDNYECAYLPVLHPAAAMRQWAWTYMIRHDLKARVPLALNNEWGEPEYEFLIQPSFDDVILYLGIIIQSLIAGPTRISVDIESIGNHIDCCGLATSKTEAICIPFTKNDDPADNYWSESQELEIIHHLRRIFTHPNAEIIGQNYLYDAQYFALYWAVISPCHLDTMIAHHVCWPGTPKDLSHLSSLYCKYHRYWKDDSRYRGKNVSDEQHWTYNCRDCVIDWEISYEVEKSAEKLGLLGQLAAQMRQFQMTLRMMLRGIRIDLVTRAKVSLEIAEQVVLYEKRFEIMMPQAVWPRKPKASPWYNSPKQLGEIFYDVLGVHEIRQRKTGSRTTDDAALETLLLREPLLAPIIRAMQEYRSLSVFQNNFCRAALDSDSRMRCSFNIAGTETFRWSSSENAFGRGTNLQNIPVGTED